MVNGWDCTWLLVRFNTWITLMKAPSNKAIISTSAKLFSEVYNTQFSVTWLWCCWVMLTHTHIFYTIIPLTRSARRVLQRTEPPCKSRISDWVDLLHDPYKLTAMSYYVFIGMYIFTSNFIRHGPYSPWVAFFQKSFAGDIWSSTAKFYFGLASSYLLKWT